jgi:uncharacterized ferritin-like protein (DUF455 family)
MELRQQALRVLAIADPQEKVASTLALWEQRDSLTLASCDDLLPGDLRLPGRPDRPTLKPARDVPSRSPFTTQGLAALMHAVCHIEFNAINLALDAVWRFPGMPDRYYTDWLRVAYEESTHFVLVRDHLASLGHAYGDFDAHDGLWAMCEKTRDDVVARMAVVPRTLEARGLDATPLIQEKLQRVGTPDALKASAILDIILRDEVGHVEVGNHWYHWLCAQQGLDPVALDQQLVEKLEAPRLRPPFNLEARRRAGFTPEEMQRYEDGGHGGHGVRS